VAPQAYAARSEMEKRETQARKGAGGRASAVGRWLPFVGASTAVAALTLIAAGGGDRATAGARADVHDVTALASNQFTPSQLPVKVGDTVRWTNSGGGQHNVRFDDGSFDDPPDPSTANWIVSRSFTTEGSFGYYCEQHPAMRGTVSVTAATVPPGPPPPGGGTPPPGGGSPPPGGGSQPGSPSPGAPGGAKSTTTVTLQVSDATPARGVRVRLFGTVRPAQDGRLLQLQRRAGGGSYRTVARIKLADAGASRSKFSKRLRVLKDTVFRARLSADSTHAAGTSRTRRVNVP
jgi:plastocyanin